MIKIREDIEILELAGINIVIDKTETPQKALFSLNETALYIWNQLKKGTTPETLVCRMQSEYDVEAEQAAEDIEEFLQSIREKGILEG